MGVSSKNQKEMANRVDPDETAHYKLSHLELPCLQRYRFWSTGLKELRSTDTLSREVTPT